MINFPKESINWHVERESGKAIKLQVSQNWANGWPLSNPQRPPGRGHDPATCRNTWRKPWLHNHTENWSKIQIMADQWTNTALWPVKETVTWLCTSLSFPCRVPGTKKDVGLCLSSLSAVGFWVLLERLFNHASLNFLTAFLAFIWANCAASEDKSRRSC